MKPFGRLNRQAYRRGLWIEFKDPKLEETNVGWLYHNSVISHPHNYHKDEVVWWPVKMRDMTEYQDGFPDFDLG